MRPVTRGHPFPERADMTHAGPLAPAELERYRHYLEILAEAPVSAAISQRAGGFGDRAANTPSKPGCGSRFKTGAWISTCS